MSGVLNLQVTHFTTDGKTDTRQGVLGKESFNTRVKDCVEIVAQLTRPAYAYIIAYRPDGTEEMCFPESEDEPPPLSDRPRYPFADQRVNYELNEGAGLCAFAVVVSNTPLPPYKHWRAGLGESPWGKYIAHSEVVIVDDGQLVELWTPTNDPRTKGRIVTAKTPIVNLTQWLRSGSQVDVVAAVGFPIADGK